MDLASVEGLEGLTIGRLARSLGLSKGGVVGHFPSKEELQLAIVEAARRRFEQEVLEELGVDDSIISAKVIEGGENLQPHG